MSALNQAAMEQAMLAISLFILSVLFSTYSQFWQKRAAQQFNLNEDASVLKKIFSRPVVLAVLFLMLGAASWLGVLTQWDVSFAYPLLSINFVAILLLSHWVFHEPVSKRQLTGVTCVVIGVALMAGGA